MAQRPIADRIRVKNITFDVADLYARAQIADVARLQTDVAQLQTNVTNLTNNKVAKAGDTMTGTLTMAAGNQVKLAENGGTYGSVNAGANFLTLTAVDGNGNTRILRLKSPNGEANDVFSLHFLTNQGMYYLDFTGYTTFSGTALMAAPDMEYTNNNEIGSLTITWPAVTRGLIFGVNFSSSSSFSGVTHRTAGGTTFTPKQIGTTSESYKRYNLICWHDGRDYWCAANGANL